MTNRRIIRETVFQALYACIVGGHSYDYTLDTIIRPLFKDDLQGIDFAEQLFLRTMDKQDQHDSIIREHTTNWEIERLAVIDRIILHLAITEFLNFEDIPAKVTLNEAIEMAKKFSTAKSGRFVNGILDAVLLQFSDNKQIKNKGRGLLDQPAKLKRIQNPGRTRYEEVDNLTSRNQPEDEETKNETQPDDTSFFNQPPLQRPELPEEISRPRKSKKNRIKRPRKSRNNLSED